MTITKRGVRIRLYTGLGDNYLVENAMDLWGVSPPRG